MLYTRISMNLYLIARNVNGVLFEGRDAIMGQFHHQINVEELRNFGEGLNGWQMMVCSGIILNKKFVLTIFTCILLTKKTTQNWDWHLKRFT